MTDRPHRRSFAARPVDPEHWIKATDAVDKRVPRTDFTARLTIDVTPEQRGLIKIAAFQRGVTVADMLRDVLQREFPPTSGER